jgi:hypothetical protein
MRLDLRLTAMVLLCIFVIYFLELNKDFYLDRGSQIYDPVDQDIYMNNQYWITLDWPIKIRLFRVTPNDFSFINKLEKLIYYIVIFLLIIGFISYGGEIHDTVKHSKNLTWIDVINDSSICRLKDRKGFLHYLKVGLGMKI